MAFGTNESAFKDLLEDIQGTISDFPVSLKDLRHPKSEFMVNYFQAFLEDFGVDVKNLIKPLEDMDFGDESSVVYRVEGSAVAFGVCRILCAMKELYPERVGLLDDMSFNSLMDPRPNDMYFVRAATNFLRFAQSRTYSVHDDPEMKEKERQLANLKRITDESDSIKEKLERQIKNDHHRKNRTIQLRENFQILKSEIDGLRFTLDQEKIKKDPLVQKATQLHSTLGLLRQKNDKKSHMANSIQFDVVRSPDRIVYSKQEIGERLQELEVKNKRHCKNFCEKRSKFQTQKKIEKELRAVSEVCKSALSLAAQTENSELHINDLAKKSTWLVEVGEETKNKLVRRKKILEAKKGERRNLMLAYEAQSKEELHLKGKEEALKRELPKYKSVLKKLEDESNSLEKKMNSSNENLHEEWIDLETECQDYEDQIRNFIVEFDRDLSGKYKLRKAEARAVRQELRGFPRH